MGSLTLFRDEADMNEAIVNLIQELRIRAHKSKRECIEEYPGEPIKWCDKCILRESSDVMEIFITERQVKNG